MNHFDVWNEEHYVARKGVCMYSALCYLAFNLILTSDLIVRSQLKIIRDQWLVQVLVLTPSFEKATYIRKLFFSKRKDGRIKVPISKETQTFTPCCSGESPFLKDFFFRKRSSNLEHSWICSRVSFRACSKSKAFRFSFS